MVDVETGILHDQGPGVFIDPIIFFHTLNLCGQCLRPRSVRGVYRYILLPLRVLEDVAAAPPVRGVEVQFILRRVDVGVRIVDLPAVILQ